MVRWPDKIRAGTVSNAIMSNLDWAPTLLAAAGEPDVKDKLLKGYEADGKQFKVHLDGYNFLPYLTGQETTSPRIEYFYFSDDGDLLALRHGNWKVQFKVQDEPGTLRIWQREFENLRLPYLFNLKTDPYERATITSNTYWDWYIRHVFLLVPAQRRSGTSCRPSMNSHRAKRPRASPSTRSCRPFRRRTAGKPSRRGVPSSTPLNQSFRKLADARRRLCALPGSETRHGPTCHTRSRRARHS
jgi:hypothetical protein